ncbi:MAG: AMP-binding protein, partial [Gemmatimonadetes bacterium]|nr:AMP-binding protein [Gemmatimonadota bacterium]
MESRPWHMHYPPGVPADLSIEDVWLPEQLSRSVARFPDRTAIIFQNCRLSYRELNQEVDRLGSSLSALGVVPGDRVAIQLPNIPQCVIGFYAALRIGAVPSMTNPLYVPREIEYQWNDCGARVAIVADFIYESKVKAIRERLPIKDFIIASIPEYLRFPLNLLAPLKLRRMAPPAIARVARGPGIHFFREIIRAAAPAAPRPAITGEQPAVLLYTGGTTGVSKGATLTHRNLSANVQQLIAWFVGLGVGSEVQLAALPYFHSFGMTVAMTFPIAIAATLVLIPNPRDIRAVLREIERHRVTLAPQVPAMFNAINHYPDVERLDLKSVKVCNSGSAPLSVDVLRRFEELTGARIVEGYGLTETSPVTHCNPIQGLRKVGSIGVPLPSTDARIVDIDSGTTDVAAGSEGELILRGPQVMAGYWQKP